MDPYDEMVDAYWKEQSLKDSTAGPKQKEGMTGPQQLMALDAMQPYFAAQARFLERDRATVEAVMGREERIKREGERGSRGCL